jgi:hypothetical protein
MRCGTFGQFQAIIAKVLIIHGFWRNVFEVFQAKPHAKHGMVMPHERIGVTALAGFQSHLSNETPLITLGVQRVVYDGSPCWWVLHTYRQNLVGVHAVPAGTDSCNKSTFRKLLNANVVNGAFQVLNEILEGPTVLGVLKNL